MEKKKKKQDLKQKKNNQKIKKKNKNKNENGNKKGSYRYLRCIGTGHKNKVHRCFWMLLIGLTSLLIAVGLGAGSTSAKTLNSSSITPTLLTRITSILLLFSAAISFNRLYVEAIGSGLGLYSGLFHVTTVTQAMEVFLYVVGSFILSGYASESSNRNSVKRNKNNLDKQTIIPSIAEYPIVVVFTTIGASFLISSADLVSMYLSIELQSFAVYILAAIYRNSESATSAGLKYFLLGALSSALILLGSSLIYAYTGLTHFDSIYMFSSCNSPSTRIDMGQDTSATRWGSEITSGGILLGFLLIGVGFLFKVAAAPFHNWAPDVYDGVPTIVTTWLTVMPKISLFIFLIELQGFSSSFGNGLFFGNERARLDIWKRLLLTTSLLSLVIGTVVGLAQYRLKRLLAFSTISHVGFLLLALSVNSEESMTSFLFYLIQYSITNLDAFFVVLALGYLLSTNNKSVVSYDISKDAVLRNNKKGTDISYISQLKGQFHSNPILRLSLAVCLFSIAGIPPLMGFFAKYRVLYSAIENGYYFLALVGILASVISAAYYLRIIRVLFMSENKENKVENSNRILDNNIDWKNVLSSTHSYVISVLTLFILFFILSPSLFLNSSNLLALSLFTA